MFLKLFLKHFREKRKNQGDTKLIVRNDHKIITELKIS